MESFYVSVTETPVPLPGRPKCLVWADATEISSDEVQENGDLALQPASLSYRTISSCYNSQSDGLWTFNKQLFWSRWSNRTRFTLPPEKNGQSRLDKTLFLRRWAWGSAAQWSPREEKHMMWVPNCPVYHLESSQLQRRETPGECGGLSSWQPREAQVKS